MSLTAATRSEFTKQFSTAMWWILAIVLFLYVGVIAAGIAFAFSASATGALPSRNGEQLPGAGLAPPLYSLASSIGYVFPLLIGTMMVTSEFRHQTLTPTFLATPRRGLVMGAKVVIAVVLGVIYAVVAIVAAVGPSAALLSGYGLDTEFTSSNTWALLGRIVIGFALWALVGVGVGALVRNQVAAIVIVLAFTQFIGPLAQFAATLVKGLDNVVQFLPGAASDALVGSSVFALTAQGSGAGHLSWWGGGLVLLAYAVVFVVLGYLTSWRRDVS